MLEPESKRIVKTKRENLPELYRFGGRHAIITLRPLILCCFFNWKSEKLKTEQDNYFVL